MAMFRVTLEKTIGLIKSTVLPNHVKTETSPGNTLSADPDNVKIHYVRLSCFNNCFSSLIFAYGSW